MMLDSIYLISLRCFIMLQGLDEVLYNRTHSSSGAGLLVQRPPPVSVVTRLLASPFALDVDILNTADVSTPIKLHHRIAINYSIYINIPCHFIIAACCCLIKCTYLLPAYHIFSENFDGSLSVTCINATKLNCLLPAACYFTGSGPGASAL